jgi:hypothetical protein
MKFAPIFARDQCGPLMNTAPVIQSAARMTVRTFEDGIEPVARSNREVFGAFLRDNGGQDLAVADIELDLTIDVAINFSSRLRDGFRRCRDSWEGDG